MRNATGLIAAAALAFPFTALAQADFPNKPIRIIVASSAGSPLDLMARQVGDWWHKRMGQPVIAEARPGASAMIATEAALRSPPDGYTLLSTSANALASQPYFMKVPPYHPVRDTTPIAIVQSAGLFYAVHESHPARTIAELVAWMKANPGKLNYGEAGVPSVGTEDFFARLGLDATRVRYKGGAPAFAALLSGETQFGLINADFARTNAGKIRALAFTDLRRHSALPEVPTVNETVLPGFRDVFWLGIVGPAGIPPAIANKLNAETAEYLRTPEAIQSIRSQGREPMIVDVAGMRREIETVMRQTEPLVARGVIVPQ
jgi:tripartite-type tricarboxylate transporter receptor subunit TctC